MKFRTYRIWKLIIVMLLSAGVAVAVGTGNPWIPAPAAVVAMVLMILLRRKVTEIVIDERSHAIANRASRFTFQAGTLILVLVGGTFMALARSTHPELAPYADTLIFSGCGLLVLYLLSILYHSGKMGGAEEL